MGIQDDKKQFLEILLVCLYTLSSASKSTVADGVSKREVIISAQKDPILSPGYSQLDFHSTHEKAVPNYSLHGLSYPETKQKHQEPLSGRKRRSAPGSPASEVEEGSLDRRRELYNDFLRKVLRNSRHGKSKKEKTVSKSEKKNATGTDAAKNKTSLKSSPAPSTRTENRNRTSGKLDQAINTGLRSEKAPLPTPETSRAYTLSPEQREKRRQILIKRNKEERLQRLRELHRRQNAARSRKSSTKHKDVRKNINHSSRPRLSTNGKRRPGQKHAYHKKDTGTKKVTRPTVKPKKSVGSTPKSQENRTNPGKDRTKGKGNVSVKRRTKVDNNVLVIEPTKANPFISAPRANDYLTRVDSIAERKKYPRRVILKEKTNQETDSSTSLIPNAISSRSNSRQSAFQDEKRQKQKKNGNKIESTSGTKLTPRGRFRSDKSGAGESARISKNDKKRIRRIRKNRLKLRQRKRRNNRKRKHRNRKSRTRHRLSSQNPTSTPVIMTSSSKKQISSPGPNAFSSTNKRLQRKNEQETSTASFIPTTTTSRNTSFLTSSALLQRPNESEKVSNASTVPSVVNSFNDEAVIKDTQVTSEPDPPVNTSARARDTTAARDEEIKRAGERNHTTTNTPHQTDPLNLPPKATTASSLSAKVSTANVLDGVSRATNLTHIPHTGTVSDVGNSQELSNGNVNQLYNTSIGSVAYNESQELRNGNANQLYNTSIGSVTHNESQELSNGNVNQLYNTSIGSVAYNESQELSNGNANQLYNTSVGSVAYNESYPLNETDSSDLNNTTKTTKIQRSTTVGVSSAERLLTTSTTGTNIVTSSTEQLSHGATLDAKDRSTRETSVFTGVSKMATTPVSLTSSHSSSPSLHHDENNSSTISQSEKQLSSTASDNERSMVPDSRDNDNNNSTYTQISSSTSLPTEMSSSSTSSMTIFSSSFSQSKTTTSPYASRWIAWAKRRRKKSKNRSKASTTSGQPSQKSGGMAHGSVALALAKAEKEDSSQLASSRRPVTEPTTTKGPFIGYKTAYDFLSNQKGIKVSVLSENRRESRDINKFMGENMCEIFNKHYVPTRIGGKCV